jgi:hypothetical protein
MYLFLCGYIKEQVFHTKVATLDVLCVQIRDTVSVILHMLENTWCEQTVTQIFCSLKTMLILTWSGFFFQHSDVS